MEIIIIDGKKNFASFFFQKYFVHFYLTICKTNLYLKYKLGLLLQLILILPNKKIFD